MALGRRLRRLLDLRSLLVHWPWLVLLLAIGLVRLSKGAAVVDLYALLSRPFWPGTAQSEWLRQAQHLEDQQKISLLQGQLNQLRADGSLRQEQGDWLTAAVISRRTEGWWQQLELGAGSLEGLSYGAVVTGPGGVLGRIASVTPSTARVTLLTDPSSRVGVELKGSRGQGLLVGEGTSRPRLRFLDKDVDVQPGDVVLTSAASSLYPANLIVGVVQTVNSQAHPAPEALVQLSAPVDAIDWVRVLR
jgi:rod shape-determining protein MreC